MEPTFVFALSVTTAIVGQFMKYVWSFKPARVPGSGTPSDPLTHTALESSASGRAPKRARETTAPRVSASVHALNPAPISSHEPPSVFGRHVTERVKDSLTAFICVGVTLSMKTACKIYM